MRKGFITTLFIFLALIILCSCTGTDNTTEIDNSLLLSNVERPTVEIFSAINDCNYEQFSNNLNYEVDKSFSEEIFLDICNNINSKYGNYEKYSINSIQKNANHISIKYDLHFNSDNVLTVILIYNPNDQYNVIGLWIDSENY